MYSNIGTKCKSLAKIVGVGGAVLSSLGFFITLIVGLGNGNFESVAGLIVTFLILTPGCIIASFPLYGFGELVEKVSKIADSSQSRPGQQGNSYYADGDSAFIVPVASNDLPEL